MWWVLVALLVRVLIRSTYSYGTSVQLTPVAASGWTFSGWSGDLTGTADPATVSMTGRRWLLRLSLRMFILFWYTVLPSSVAGTSDWYVTTPTYHYGDVVTLTESASSGYTFQVGVVMVTGSGLLCQ